METSIRWIWTRESIAQNDLYVSCRCEKKSVLITIETEDDMKKKNKQTNKQNKNRKKKIESFKEIQQIMHFIHNFNMNVHHDNS